jgi:hypothetical protein
MTYLPYLTHCGLPGIDQVPVGMHACHFYRNRDELITALVPYAVAGLRGNERCLLIAAPPLPAREAIQTLRAAWDGVDDALQTGALRILDFDQLYENLAGLKGLDVVLEEEARALADGYNGLRVAGNTSFLKSGDWSTFLEYEAAVTERFNGRRIVALAQCNDQQMREVMHAHHCAFECPDTYWQVVTASVSGGCLGQSVT